MAYRSLMFGRLEPFDADLFITSLKKAGIEEDEDRLYGFFNLQRVDGYIYGMFAIEDDSQNSRIDRNKKELLEETIRSAKKVEFVINNDGIIAFQTTTLPTPQQFLRRLGATYSLLIGKDVDVSILDAFPRKHLKKIYVSLDFVHEVELSDVGKQPPNPFGWNDKERVKIIETAVGLDRLSARAKKDENIKEKEVISDGFVAWSEVRSIKGMDGTGERIFISKNGRISYNVPLDADRSRLRLIEIMQRYIGGWLGDFRKHLKKIEKP